MSFKDILVHIDKSGHCPARLDLAARLAADHGAHLTGLGLRIVPHVPRFILTQLGPEVAEAQRRLAEETARAERAAFEAVAARHALSHEWREAEGDVLEAFCLHARYTDCLVVGQDDPDDDAMDGEHGLTEHLVLDAGRPVLVVPYAGTFPTLGHTVLVAWNGSREASRAINDALPLLRRAQRVVVVVINPRGGRLGHGDIPGADISLHLARHGINSEAHSLHAEDMEVGAMLLSRATDLGADLMVMGAYGRSRLRELVLGGATRHILRHMTIPVLMSH
ncbi:universal stress protein [Pararhodospirillum oryzae]|uniref:Universal stress protein A n=1 Tax=Pararhodospirillum oryzae TaxID=478448 RepID=A0A512H7J1_9PROT|nr:universal stress protein [Pararhodospirillum oryzae]GEO81398.1 universal stress protein A [Pararhodospirillum oryzae]